MNAPMLQGQNGGLPRGELLGRYRSYEDAQKVVEHLASSEGFDVKNLSIVGNDLRTVEHIRTRLSYPRVALGGAAQGALFGAFIGLLIFTFSPDSTPLDIVMAVLMGMAIWMIIGVIGYSVRKGRRDFASSSQLVATTFDVVCDFSVAVHARRLVPGAGVVSLGLYDDPTSTPSSAPAAGPEAAAGAPAQTPPGEDSAPQDAPRPAPDRASSQTGSGYDDLPDGRPRFGVRVDADRSSAPTGQAPVATGESPAVERTEAGNTEAGNTEAGNTEAGNTDAESTDSRT